jgi:heme-degrading monooxygenase HmoA
VAALFARVSTFRGPADGIDLMVKQAQESVIPAARRLAGYQGILVLGDRGSGKSIAITLWESEQAMRESEEAANKLRSEASEAGGEEIVSVERFEVLLDEPVN